MRRQAAILLTLTLACGIVPEKLSYSDARVQELLAARSKAKPEALGFSTPPADDDYSLEGKGRGYDTMLHLYGPDRSRTIAFTKTRDGWQWVHEQEIHIGPREYENAENIKERERLILTYETTLVSGAGSNHLSITYIGDDPRLKSMPDSLTLEQVQPVLAEWGAR